MAGPAGSPTDFETLPNTTSSSITLTWKEGRHGNWPPVTHHIYQSDSMDCNDNVSYEHVANVDGTPNGGEGAIHVYIVEQLWWGTEYHFKIIASNTRHEGSRQSAALFACGSETKCNS